MPDHSVVHRYARCLSYPEWGVGSVNGIYFSGEGDDVQQWARMSFQVGIRTVPAGSLQFVDFSTPDAGAERVQRFMTAAQHALAEGKPELAAKRLIYARDADPSNPTVLRLLTVAFWQAGDLAGRRPRRPRLGAGRDRPSDAGAVRVPDLRGHGRVRSRGRGGRSAPIDRAPNDASAWARLGPAAPAADGPRRRRSRRSSTRGRSDATVEALLDLALAYHLAGDVGAEVSTAQEATKLEPESARAWSAYAHALARTDRMTECIEACERALELERRPARSPICSSVPGRRCRRYLRARQHAPRSPRDIAPRSRAVPEDQLFSIRRSDAPSRPQTGHASPARERTPAAPRALVDALQDAEQLADAADQQTFLVDLDPGAG